jgi:O-succinylbenzoate synthase
VYVEEPELIGVVRGLQEAGKDTRRGRVMGGLRRESGWGQAAESKRMSYGSGAGPKIYPGLDTDMVQAAVEEEWPGDTLPLVARARCPCYGQPFH